MSKIIVGALVLLVILGVAVAGSIFVYTPNPTITVERTVNLSGRGMTSIPQSVFAATGTEELDLSHNALTGALPSQIQNLTKLKILRANHNHMTGVPAEVGHLKNLEVLDLSYNNLTGLPYELGELTNLKVFNLAGNNYSKEDLAIIQAKLPHAQFILE